MNICFNGQFLPAHQPLFTASNRSFKWGDGFFETIKVHNEKILLQQYHFERLFLSLKMLQFKNGGSNTEETIASNIIRLCGENNCSSLARVRLALYRQDDNTAGYVIEAAPLSDEHNQWNEKGWTIGLYPYARKQTDALANLKSASYLPYILAGMFAKENNLDESILLNTSNMIADGSKTNIFLISKKQLHTPALHQGCVNGVMRRHLVTELKSAGWHVKQEELSEQHLIDADEIFLTNAIHGIRWVRTFKDRTYNSEQTLSIFKTFISTFYT